MFRFHPVKAKKVAQVNMKTHPRRRKKSSLRYKKERMIWFLKMKKKKLNKITRRR